MFGNISSVNNGSKGLFSSLQNSSQNQNSGSTNFFGKSPSQTTQSPTANLFSSITTPSQTASSSSSNPGLNLFGGLSNVNHNVANNSTSNSGPSLFSSLAFSKPNNNESKPSLFASLQSTNSSSDNNIFGSNNQNLLVSNNNQSNAFPPMMQQSSNKSNNQNSFFGTSNIFANSNSSSNIFGTNLPTSTTNEQNQNTNFSSLFSAQSSTNNNNNNETNKMQFKIFDDQDKSKSNDISNKDLILDAKPASNIFLMNKSHDQSSKTSLTSTSNSIFNPTKSPSQGFSFANITSKNQDTKEKHNDNSNKSQPVSFFESFAIKESQNDTKSLIAIDCYFSNILDMSEDDKHEYESEDFMNIFSIPIKPPARIHCQ